MLWKTDEKALLEKRAEERGKLMLRGRSAARQAAGRKVSVCAHGGGHRRLQDLSSRPPEVAPSHEGWDGVGVPCDPREGPPPVTELEWGQAFPMLAMPSSPCLQRPAVLSTAPGSPGVEVTEGSLWFQAQDPPCSLSSQP